MLLFMLAAESMRCKRPSQDGEGEGGDVTSSFDVEVGKEQDLQVLWGA